jgi:hypothetical protein
MAKKDEAKAVKARVLVDCSFGKVDDVVEVTEAQAKDHAHEIDAHPDAVAYAEKVKADAAAAAAAEAELA